MMRVLKILKYIKAKKCNLDFEFQALYKFDSYGKQIPEYLQDFC